MQLIKLKTVIILASLLLVSTGCTNTIVKPSPLPLPTCPDLVTIHPTEFIEFGENILITKKTVMKIVKRDAQRKACTLVHRAVIESTHVE